MDILITLMIQFLGKLPPEWQLKWEQLRLDAGRDSEAGKSKLLLHQGLEQVFHIKIQDPELKGLLPVIKGLIIFLPSDRVSASQALGLINAQRTEVSDDEPDAKDSGKRNEDMLDGDEKQDIKICKTGMRIC